MLVAALFMSLLPETAITPAMADLVIEKTIRSQLLEQTTTIMMNPKLD